MWLGYLPNQEEAKYDIIGCMGRRVLGEEERVLSMGRRHWVGLGRILGMGIGGGEKGVLGMGRGGGE